MTYTLTVFENNDLQNRFYCIHGAKVTFVIPCFLFIIYLYVRHSTDTDLLCHCLCNACSVYISFKMFSLFTMFIQFVLFILIFMSLEEMLLNKSRCLYHFVHTDNKDPFISKNTILRLMFKM